MMNKKSRNRDKYLVIRKKSIHKMAPIPICKFD